MTHLPEAISKLISALGRLPGVGPKTATRLAFYLLNVPEEFNQELAGAVSNLKRNIRTCRVCYGVSETDECFVCADSRRNRKVICVVERVVDMLALENVGGYTGVYHVLGGVINPLDHIGPEDLKIAELIERIKVFAPPSGAADDLEIILATNPTMEGEATALYIKNLIQRMIGQWPKISDLRITRIGSGLPMGGDLEYADMATLAHAMAGRQVF